MRRVEGDDADGAGVGGREVGNFEEGGGSGRMGGGVRAREVGGGACEVGEGYEEAGAHGWTGIGWGLLVRQI